MHPCPWRDNPLRRLPAKVARGNLELAVNSEVPVPFSHFGTEKRVTARCRLCPYLFEGECTYPHPAALPAGRTPKLAAWAVGIGESPDAAANAASSGLKARLGATVPAYAVMIVACSTAVTPAETQEMLLRAVDSLPEKVRFYYRLEALPAEKNPGSLVLLCAWTAG